MVLNNAKKAKTIEELYEIITGTSSVMRGNPKETYTHDQWVNIFQTYEQYPEAIEAMKTISSKLYKSLK